MANATTDEIADLVAQAKAEKDAEEGVEGEVNALRELEETEEAEAKPPKRKRTRRSTNGSKKNKDELPTEPDEEEVERLLEAEITPAENVKNLGTLYAKYDIGDHPEFKIQVWRTWPKMAPGGKKFDGFYDTWDTPLSLEEIQSEYGGGNYRIVVVGPNPNKVNVPKHYDSHLIQLAGPPKYERVPRALQDTDTKKEDQAAGFQIPMAQVEHPKLAETALKMIGGVAERERDERHRSEARADERRAHAGDFLQPIIEAERRRADDVVAVERERAEAERQMHEQRLQEERGRAEDQRQRMETLNTSRRSFGQELRDLAEAGIFKNDDGGIAKDMLTQVLDKHRGEMDAIITRQTQFVESLRGGHASEIAAIRDAHRREMEAEREASRSREGRVEERLVSEREERRRDQDRFKESLAERDQQWRDRMESAKQLIESSWQARHQTLMSTYENKEVWQQQEIDRIKQELLDAKMKQEESGDVFTQLSKMKEMQEVIKTQFAPESTPSASASSGGIGLTGGTGWQETLAEGVAERAPAILNALFGGSEGQPPPQPQEGQVMQTPQGEMVVVRDPSGELALAPKEALEAHQRAVAAQQQAAAQQTAQPGLLDPQQKRRRSQTDQRRGGSRRKNVQAVKNLSEGLPRPIPPWEGGGGDEADLDPPPAPPAPPPSPRMTTRSRRESDAVADAAADRDPLDLTAQERQILMLIAKHVHESVMQADEPEEFVAKMMNEYDQNILRQIVGSYTTEQIAKGIVQVQPGSAGATPAGQYFVAAAFKQLRETMRDA